MWQDYVLFHNSAFNVVTPFTAALLHKTSPLILVQHLNHYALRVGGNAGTLTC